MTKSEHAGTEWCTLHESGGATVHIQIGSHHFDRIVELIDVVAELPVKQSESPQHVLAGALGVGVQRRRRGLKLEDEEAPKTNPAARYARGMRRWVREKYRSKRRGATMMLTYLEERGVDLSGVTVDDVLPQWGEWANYTETERKMETEHPAPSWLEERLADPCWEERARKWLRTGRYSVSLIGVGSDGTGAFEPQNFPFVKFRRVGDGGRDKKVLLERALDTLASIIEYETRPKEPRGSGES